MLSYTNHAVAENNSGIKESNYVSFDVSDDILPITITKIIEPSIHPMYRPGDTITFFIRLEREPGFPIGIPVGDITVTDVLDPIVSIVLAEVTTGIGIVQPIGGQTVTVTNILLEEFSPVCEITITGLINFP